MRRITTQTVRVLCLTKRWHAKQNQISKKEWCPERDLNPHSSRHCPLKTACLPIPPPGHSLSCGVPGEPRYPNLRRHASRGRSLTPVCRGTCTPVQRLPILPPGHSLSCGVPGEPRYPNLRRHASRGRSLTPVCRGTCTPVQRLPIPPPGHCFKFYL